MRSMIRNCQLVRWALAAACVRPAGAARSPGPTARSRALLAQGANGSGREKALVNHTTSPFFNLTARTTGPEDRVSATRKPVTPPGPSASPKGARAVTAGAHTKPAAA